jgi:mRNA interferase RelE/StbE
MKILYHPKAIKFLSKLPKKTSLRVLEKIEALKKSPYSGNLDIKKLVGTKQFYRLRIANIRAIFKIDISTKTIFIRDIDYRGNIY